ncbi:MAG: AEC family transporter [Chloroflexia bacterium]
MKNLLPIFVQVILPLALVWLAGFLGRRLLHLDPRPFSRAGLYLLTPAVIFTTLMEAEITLQESGRILLLVLLLAGLLILLSRLQLYFLRLSPGEGSALTLSAVFINSVNYGFPATLLALGPAGLERAAVFAVGHAFLVNTIGAYIAARGRAGSLRETLSQVARIPMFYAVALAVLLRLAGVSFSGTFALWGLEIPLLPSLYQAVKLLSQAAIPVFMLVLGMQLGVEDADPLPRRLYLPLFLAGLTRLVLSPLLAWGLALLLGLSGIAAQAAILEAAMPSAVITVILATEFDTQPRLVSQVVVWTTLFSMVTLTLLLGLLKVES